MHRVLYEKRLSNLTTFSTFSRAGFKRAVVMVFLEWASRYKLVRQRLVDNRGGGGRFF